MKILHTSDWHLGKKLEGKSRLAEQRDFLGWLCEIADSENIDVVVVAGDIFDTVNPPSEAEELFYSIALRLAATRLVVCVAGNHDNADRLSAPAGIASASNIILVGKMDNSVYTRGDVVGGNGWIRYKKNGETLNLALLPYPSYSRMSALGVKIDGQKTYAENVEIWLKECASCFSADATNILVSHLFMENSARSSAEIELGTAALLPASVLPIADYTALGHIHKSQKVSSMRNAYYSGSPMKYSFDDTGEQFVNVVDGKAADENGLIVKKIAVNAGKKLITQVVKTYDEAIDFLDKNSDAWVKILYDSPDSLSSAKFSALRARENLCSVTPIYKASRARAVERKKSDKELFEEFYKKEYGEDASDDVVQMFLSALMGEEI